jgi:hypothetical protein
VEDRICTGYALGGSRYTSVSHKSSTSPGSQTLRDVMEARAGSTGASVVDGLRRKLRRSRRGNEQALLRSRSNMLQPLPQRAAFRLVYVNGLLIIASISWQGRQSEAERGQTVQPDVWLGMVVEVSDRKEDCVRMQLDLGVGTRSGGLNGFAVPDN